MIELRLEVVSACYNSGCFGLLLCRQTKSWIIVIIIIIIIIIIGLF